METNIVVTGAYGRDYEKALDAKKDWDVGLDFFILSKNGLPMRTYCSNRDFESGTEVTIRFGKLRHSTIFNMEQP